MTTYVISPGAWQTGSGLNPEPRGQPAGNTTGLNPEPRSVGGSSARLHPEPRSEGGGQAGGYPQQQPGGRCAGSAPLPSAPWRGVDPTWVYQGGTDALTAQALERTRGEILRPSDPRLPPRAKGLMPIAGNAAGPARPFWRWGSQFRVEAVLADLAWRLRVQARELKLTATQAVSLSLAPSAQGLSFIERQIDKVQRAAIEREDRMPEILAQRDDFREFFRVILGLDATTTPILEEVLAVAWYWATPLVMALKNDVAALRPVQRAASVLPVIPTPAHGSLPSGHATMAALTAEILSQLLFNGDPKHARVQQLDRLARRIAFNRVVAGVHFPVDSAAGYALGLQLAGHFVGWATGRPALKEYKFDPTKHSELTETGKRPKTTASAKYDGKSANLALLWDAAKREARRGGA